MRIAPRATDTPTPYVVPVSQKFDGNDGSWSTFQISVGTPGQEFRVLASTRSGETQVIVPDGCQSFDPSNCTRLRGIEAFQSQQNAGFEANESSTWDAIGMYEVDVESRLNISAPAIYGYDTVGLGPYSDTSTLSLQNQVVGGVADMSYFLGLIPLGSADSTFSSLSQPIDSFLHQLRNQTKIPSFSFAYTAGAEYRLKSVFAQLILGGYDTTRFQFPFSFTFNEDPSRLLTVGVDSISATNTLKGSYSLTSSAHFSLIDSTVPHLWLPEDVCDAFAEAFGLTYDASTDLYLINDTMHDQVVARNPEITIKLVNSLEDTITNYTNIVLPYAAFDLQASYPYYQNTTNYFPVRRATNESQYTLGRTLLQEAYLIVDYERANFTIAQAAFPDPLPDAQIVTIHPPGSNNEEGRSSGGLSIGAIAGIAVGGGVLLALVLLGAFLLWRKRRSSNRKYELANTELSASRSSSDPSSTAALKTSSDPQELGGTHFAELASPTHHQTEKPYTTPTTVPQELETPTQILGPQWREVSVREYYEMSGESAPPSGAPSDYDERSSERGTQSSGRETGIVSPMVQSPRSMYGARF